VQPCQNWISIRGPKADIRELLREPKTLSRLIEPHVWLANFLEVDFAQDTWIVNLACVDLREPATTAVRGFMLAHPHLHVRLEYANRDEEYVGMFESKNGTISGEHLAYHSMSELQDFARRTGHLEAQLMVGDKSDD